ncbi:MAG TPA: HD-GYP domain-containing protein [Cyanobacteria bacterium UBA8530]|nr:HD-GYP domain-containing protein [Cyanobacteria bacterium UBA8530]
MPSRDATETTLYKDGRMGYRLDEWAQSDTWKGIALKIIRVDSLKLGMQIARDLFGPNGIILLRRGVNLTEAMIRSISRLNYASIYISDGIGDDQSVIEAEVIPEAKRHEAVNIVKQFCAASSSNKLSQNAGLDVSSVVKAAKDIVQSVMENPNAVISLIDLKSFDDYTFQHSVSTCLLAVVLGRRVRLPIGNLEDLALGTLLHDLGKMTLPLTILNKPGKLTLEEFELIKSHPRAGFDLLSSNRFISAHAKAVVLQHQEKFNGTGYPKGMSGKDIHINGRIGAVVDVYDALTSDRSYRPRILPHRALAILRDGSGSHFDSELVDTFLQMVTPYPIGTHLRLSSGEEAAVITVPRANIHQPIIQVIADANGQPSADKRVIDLSSGEIQIQSVLEAE